MITLVLGGARSGKSVVAERLAARLPEPITYVATAILDPVGDPDMEARVAVHQARRPTSWRTVQAGQQLEATVAALEGTVLIDSLGAWVAGSPEFDVDTAGLCDALSGRGGDTVVVSDEVGMGVHPSSDTGRRFRDALGQVNQAVAATADEVLLVIAGRILRLEDPDIGDAGRPGAGFEDRGRCL